MTLVSCISTSLVVLSSSSRQRVCFDCSFIGMKIHVAFSQSKSLTSTGLSSLATNCFNLVKINMSNGTELTNMVTKAITEAKNLDRLRLASYKSITNSKVGCISDVCKTLRSLCLKWCLCIIDLGVGLIAMKCKEIQSSNIAYLSILFSNYYLFFTTTFYYY